MFDVIAIMVVLAVVCVVISSDGKASAITAWVFAIMGMLLMCAFVVGACVAQVNQVGM